MTISNLKDLEKLIKLCQRNGVEAITVDGIELKLGAMPQTKRTIKQDRTVETYTPGGVGPDTKIETRTWDELTDEEKLFYSAQQVMNEGAN